MRKLILYTFVVLLPAIAIGISNFTVFPDSFLLATLMLVATVGISSVFTWQSGDATPKIARYCICADFVICAILCLNLASHWILSREYSAAQKGVEERHTEEDRQLEREKIKTELEIARKKSEAEADAAKTRLTNAEARRLAQLPVSQRRSSAVPRPEPTKAPTIQPLSLAPSGAVANMSAVPIEKPRLTPEQVLDSWWWKLTALAIAEVFASVLAGGILFGIWEWDRNKDGIPDHLQSGAAPGK
jgi:hypothetical protein